MEIFNIQLKEGKINNSLIGNSTLGNTISFCVGATIEVLSLHNNNNKQFVYCYHSVYFPISTNNLYLTY